MDRRNLFYNGATQYGGSSAVAKRRGASRKAFFDFREPQTARNNPAKPSMVHQYALQPSVLKNPEPQLTAQATRILNWIETNSVKQPDLCKRQKTLSMTRFRPMPIRTTSRRMAVNQEKQINKKPNINGQYADNCVMQNLADNAFRVKKNLADEALQVKKDLAGEAVRVKKGLVDEALQVKKDLADEDLQVKKDLAGEAVQVKKDLAGEALQVKKDLAGEALQVKKGLPDEAVQVKKKGLPDEAVQVEKKDLAGEALQVKKKDLVDEALQVKKGLADEAIRVNDDLAHDAVGQMPLEIKHNEDKNMTYTCTNTAPMESDHKSVTVEFNKTELPKSPFNVSVKGASLGDGHEQVQAKDRGIETKSKVKVDTIMSRFKSPTLVCPTSSPPPMICAPKKFADPLDVTAKPKVTTSVTSLFRLTPASAPIQIPPVAKSTTTTTAQAPQSLFGSLKPAAPSTTIAPSPITSAPPLFSFGTPIQAPPASQSTTTTTGAQAPQSLFGSLKPAAPPTTSAPSPITSALPPTTSALPPITSAPPSTTSALPLFSFGAPIQTPPASQSTTTTAQAPQSLFGSLKPAAPPTTSAQPLFSFGTPIQTPPTSQPTATTGAQAPQSSFGSLKPAAPPITSAQPLFSFGQTTTPSAATTTSWSSATTHTTNLPSMTPTSAPSFSFGASIQTPPANVIQPNLFPQTPQNTGFNFGAAMVPPTPNCQIPVSNTPNPFQPPSSSVRGRKILKAARRLNR